MKKESIINKLKKKFKGKKVLIVGLGLLGGGVNLAKFFYFLGAKVIVTDKKNEEELIPSLNELKNLSIDFRLGKHVKEDFLSADIIFKGPSVPWDLPEIQLAQKKGIPVEMELAFFCYYSPAKIIGVTGTRGKSTTTHLIYSILKEQNYSVYLGGRIPYASNLFLLEKLKKDDYVVMELSSWDLSGFHRKRISPSFAVFTSFYPDHLNYYQRIEDYLYDKKAIFLYQKPNEYLVANKALAKIINEACGKVVFYDSSNFPWRLRFLQGTHNQENAACAFTVAKILNLDMEKAKHTIINFPGLPFRQEKIAEKDNIVFINDSASTTPVACQRAIETFNDGFIILIIGGNSKKLPYLEFIQALSQERIKKIILLKGSFTQEIYPLLKKKISHKISSVFTDLKNAVNFAYRQANKIKDRRVYILFSPAATSFAMFNNEFHRGEEFNKIVKEIITNDKKNPT